MFINSSFASLIFRCFIRGIKFKKRKTLTEYNKPIVKHNNKEDTQICGVSSLISDARIKVFCKNSKTLYHIWIDFWKHLVLSKGHVMFSKKRKCKFRVQKSIKFNKSYF